MTIVVVTDANVLINLVHIGKLSLLAALVHYKFRVPREVLAEILAPDQRAAVDAALMAGYLDEIQLDTIEALELFATLRDVMGRGEAACLAVAATSGFYIASDEKKRFRKRAMEFLGEARILRTESLLLEAVRRGHLPVADADACKAILETKRYSVPFGSFADLL